MYSPSLRCPYQYDTPLSLNVSPVAGLFALTTFTSWLNPVVPPKVPSSKLHAASPLQAPKSQVPSGPGRCPQAPFCHRGPWSLVPEPRPWPLGFSLLALLFWVSSSSPFSKLLFLSHPHPIPDLDTSHSHYFHNCRLHTLSAEAETRPGPALHLPLFSHPPPSQICEHESICSPRSFASILQLLTNSYIPTQVQTYLTATVVVQLSTISPSIYQPSPLTAPTVSIHSSSTLSASLILAQELVLGRTVHTRFNPSRIDHPPSTNVPHSLKPQPCGQVSYLSLVNNWALITLYPMLNT